MSGAVHEQPVFSQTLQTCNLVANFVVKNFRAATGDRIQSSIAQADNRIAHAESAVFSDRQNLRRGIAMQVNFWKALLDAAEHLLVPFDLEVGVEAALHQYAGAAEFYGLLDFVVDRVEIKNVAFLGAG